MDTEGMIIKVAPGYIVGGKRERVLSRGRGRSRMGFFGSALAVCLLIPVAAGAIKAGPGVLDVRATLAIVLDNNVNYTADNAEEAVEAQLSPGISYELPIGHHSLKLGYHSTLVRRDDQNANALRQSPFGILSLTFPGGLDITAVDRISLVQDRKEDENEELDSPDYAINQASVNGSYVQSGVMTVVADFRHTTYRYESTAEYRNSDGNDISASVAVPVSERLAMLAVGRWANEVSPDVPVRNYRNYNMMGGVRVFGASRVKFDITAGYQSFDYYDDPSEKPENSFALRLASSAVLSPIVNLETNVATDVRAGALVSGTAEFCPLAKTRVIAEFSRTANRTFFLNHKYYINTDVELLIKQEVLRATELYAKLSYAWIDYPRTDDATNSSNPGANTREDIRSGWRIGLQYETGPWAVLGLFGEFQQRESNVDVPFSNYMRTMIGASATVHSPL